jgi:hypothetical protein
VREFDTNLVIACALTFPARAIPTALSQLHMLLPVSQGSQADPAYTAEYSTPCASYEAKLILSICPQEQAILILSADAFLKQLVEFRPMMSASDLFVRISPFQAIMQLS